MGETVQHPLATGSAESEPVRQRMSPGAGFAGAIPWYAIWVVITTVAAVLSTALVFAVGGTRGFFLPVLAACICTLAAFFDGCTGRIPNKLTYPAILLGLGLNALVPVLAAAHWTTAVTWLAGTGAQSSLLGFGVCALLTLLSPFLGGGVHGGDLKLMAAVGAMLGLLQTGNVLIVAFSMAIVYSLINLLVRGKFNTAIRMACLRMLELLYFRRLHTPLPDDPAPLRAGDATHIPMAVPLAAGLVAAQVWQWMAGVR
jgi:prepilin signal peptidase PulO-like enzyme (type II secretory pathway)